MLAMADGNTLSWKCLCGVARAMLTVAALLTVGAFLPVSAQAQGVSAAEARDVQTARAYLDNDPALAAQLRAKGEAFLRANRVAERFLEEDFPALMPRLEELAERAAACRKRKCPGAANCLAIEDALIMVEQIESAFSAISFNLAFLPNDVIFVDLPSELRQKLGRKSAVFEAAGGQPVTPADITKAETLLERYQGFNEYVQSIKTSLQRCFDAQICSRSRIARRLSLSENSSDRSANILNGVSALQRFLWDLSPFELQVARDCPPKGGILVFPLDGFVVGTDSTKFCTFRPGTFVSVPLTPVPSGGPPSAPPERPGEPIGGDTPGPCPLEAEANPVTGGSAGTPNVDDSETFETEEELEKAAEAEAAAEAERRKNAQCLPPPAPESEREPFPLIFIPKNLPPCEELAFILAKIDEIFKVAVRNATRRLPPDLDAEAALVRLKELRERRDQLLPLCPVKLTEPPCEKASGLCEPKETPPTPTSTEAPPAPPSPPVPPKAPDPTPPETPIKIFVKATSQSVERGAKAQEVAGQQVKLFPESVRDVALPGTNAAKPQTDHDKDPVQGVTNAAGELVIDATAGDAGLPGKVGILADGNGRLPAFAINIDTTGQTGRNIILSGPATPTIPAGLKSFNPSVSVAGGKTVISLLLPIDKAEQADKIIAESFPGATVEEDLCRVKEPLGPKGEGSWQTLLPQASLPGAKISLWPQARGERK